MVGLGGSSYCVRTGLVGAKMEEDSEPILGTS